MASLHPSPVFIVGSPRSGTSLLVRALRNAGYFGFNEGNFFGLLEEIYRTTDNYYVTFGTDNPLVMISQIEREEFKTSVAELFKRIVDRTNTAAPWLDKSGNASVVRMVPVLARLWPAGHFVFAKRRAIENVASRLKKFPSVSFEEHCKGWAETMSVWRTVRQALPGLKCIEVEQQDMARDPLAVAEALGTFLAFSDEQKATLEKTFREDRPEQTGAGTAERVLPLGATGWSAQQTGTFIHFCKPEMDRFGYTLDESYRVPRASPAA